MRYVKISIVYVVIIAILLGTWLGCIHRLKPFTLAGCTCPHSRFTSLHLLTPDDICPPQADPPPSYPGLLYHEK